MTKVMIAAALAASVVMLNSAQAATRHVHRASGTPHVTMPNNVQDAYGQASLSRDPVISGPNGGWENRSLIYRGPTYIGQY